MTEARYCPVVAAILTKSVIFAERFLQVYNEFPGHSIAQQLFAILLPRWLFLRVQKYNSIQIGIRQQRFLYLLSTGKFLPVGSKRWTYARTLLFLVFFEGGCCQAGGFIDGLVVAGEGGKRRELAGPSLNRHRLPRRNTFVFPFNQFFHKYLSVAIKSFQDTLRLVLCTANTLRAFACGLEAHDGQRRSSHVVAINPHRKNNHFQ